MSKPVPVDLNLLNKASNYRGGDCGLALDLDCTIRMIRYYRKGRKAHPSVVDKIKDIIIAYEKMQETKKRAS